MNGDQTVERASVSLLYLELEPREELDQERLRAENHKLFDEIARLAGARGGRAEETPGNALRIAFAVPFARMPAQDALAVAEEIGRFINASPLERDWRIAIATGAAVREGEVLIGDVSNRVRTLIERTDVASIELDEETRRLASSATTGDDVELLARDAERSSIEGVFAACISEGRCHRLLLVAEPGVGKSRLANETLEGLSGRAQRAIAQCQPWGSGSLAPLEDTMTQLFPGLKRDPHGTTRRFLEGSDDGEVVVAQISRLFGWGDAPDVSDVSVWSVRRLLEESSRDQPVVLFLDDLHWAEDPLLDAIEDLSTRLRGAVLLLCAARWDLLERRPDMVLQSRNRHFMKLAPLDREKAIVFVEGWLGSAVEAGTWLDDLLDAAQGSPLFLVEALSNLREKDQLVLAEGHWRAPPGSKISMSPSIEALLGARITSLPRDEREVIEAAAAWGIDFEVDVLQALLPSTYATNLLGRLARLKSKDYIEMIPGRGSASVFRLRHALIRDAAYELCAKERRIRLHRGAALHGEKAGLPNTFIGHHFEQVYRLMIEMDPADPEAPAVAKSASSRFAAAGRSERARGSYKAAVDLFYRATGLRADRDADWVEVSIAAAECLMELARFDEARALTEQVNREAEASGDQRLVARAELLTTWEKTTVDYSTAPEVELSFKRLLPIFEEEQDEVAVVRIYRGLAEWHWTQMMCGPTAEAMKRGLEYSLRTPQKFDLAHIMSGLSATALWGPTPVKEAKALCGQLLELAGDDPFSTALVSLKLASLEALAAEFEPARDRGREARRALLELGQEVTAATGTQEIGMIELLAGNLDAARVLFQLGFDELTDLGEISYRATIATQLGRVLYDLGQPEEALGYIEIAEEIAEEDVTIKPETFPIRALMAADRGDGRAAVDLIESARAEVYRSDQLPVQATVEIQAARTFARLARPTDQREALERARTLCESKGAKALRALADAVAIAGQVGRK